MSAENLAIDCEAFDARGGARFDIVFDDGETGCELHDPFGVFEARE